MDETFYYAIVIVLLLIIVNYESIEGFLTRSRVCNDIDGRCYPTVKRFEGKSSSETLAYLNMFTVKLLRHMRRKYLWDNEGTRAEAHAVQNILANYNPDNIIENDPSGDVNTSYVEDKGQVFAMCLREKKTGKNLIHDNNILEFVLMHELSHLATDQIGHENKEFWSNFKLLMENAQELGLHIPTDYGKTPVNYCSLDVDYSPYFDKSVTTM